MPDQTPTFTAATVDLAQETAPAEPTSTLAAAPLLRLLEESKAIPNTVLQSIAERSQGNAQALEQILHNEGYIEEGQLMELMARAYGWETVDLSKQFLVEEVLALLPKSVAEAQRVIPFARDEAGLKVATLDPGNRVLQRLLQKKCGSPVRLYLTSQSAFEAALTNYNTIFHTRFAQLSSNDRRRIGHGGAQDSVIDLVDTLLLHSIRQGASDIHVEPNTKNTIVRERIDGILRKSVNFSKEVHERLTQRIKVMANLATDEHAMPQDGKLVYWTPEDKRVDVRVSIVPTMHGEKIVMRILVAQQLPGLESLGCRERDRGILEEESKRSWGMILITGPTGSGKSTTLYTVLQRLNTPGVNVSTIEDPVEYDLPGSNQIQVNERTGLTFASGLRALVRQDPNIILVGEIRDRETAGIAVNAAMTGHLVLSTLHTNNAATTIPRLLDMNIEPFLIASVVNIIVAQRLIRRTCPDCREEIVMKSDDLAAALPPEIFQKLLRGEPQITLYQGKGCELCKGLGFRGRFGIFEILRVSPAIQDMIIHKATAEAIQQQALNEGMTTMIDDGVEKVRTGLTTIHELLRVIRS